MRAFEMKVILLFIGLSYQFAFAEPPTGTVSTNLGTGTSIPIFNGSFFNSNVGDINNLFNPTNNNSANRANGEPPQRTEPSESLKKELEALKANIRPKELESYTKKLKDASIDDLIEEQKRALQNKPQDQTASSSATPDSYQFLSPAGDFRDDLMRVRDGLYHANPQFGKHQQAREIGLTATEEADRTYSQGDVDEGHFYKTIAENLLDLVVGVDPVTGFGRSIYELFVGRNFITGVDLSETERAFAAVTVVSLGTTNTLKVAGKALLGLGSKLPKLAQQAPKITSAVNESARIFDSVGNVATKTLGNGTKIAEESLFKPYKGASKLGHAFQKHADRNPGLWGKVTGKADSWLEQGMKHYREIMDAPGDLQLIQRTRIEKTTGKTIETSFFEKRLSDGRGIRFRQDGTFETFLD